MRRCLLLLVFFFLATVSYAQVRVVRGAVKTETGAAFPDVVITVESGETFFTKADGTFEIRVSSSFKTLTFSAEKYSTVVMPIDGSYLLVRMEISPETKIEEERLSREERLAEEARQRAERDSIVAIEMARRDSLAAVEMAQKDSLHAIEKASRASKALANQLQAEEEARLRAERRAERRARIKEKDDAYDKLFVNRGISHSIRASYAVQIASCETVYQYSGYRTYGSLHPFTIDYTISYKFNRLLSIGVGAGVLFNAKSITIPGESFVFPENAYGNTYYYDFPEHRLDIPVFASLSLHPGRRKLRPAITLSGGMYLLSRLFIVEGMLGLEYRMGRIPSLEAGLIFKTTPYPFFDLDKRVAGYQVAASPGFAVRYNF